MDVTVAICTWNRAKVLDQTLTAMRNLRIPDGLDWELLVVNNNCTDDTDDVIARHEDTLPIRCLFEPRSGLSFARNLVLDAARGDIILWTDDDVIVAEGWLEQYLIAAAQWPDAAFFGGKIEPLFPVDPPGWIKKNLRLLSCVYSVQDLGDTNRPFTGEESPIGANMAIRRKSLNGQTFNLALGPTGSNMVLGEETELIEEIQSSGHYGVYVGQASVRHHIMPQRLSKQYLLAWFRAYGRAMAQRGEIGPCRTFFGLPLWAIRVYSESRLKALVLGLRKGPKWVRAYERAGWAMGILEHSWNHRWHTAESKSHESSSLLVK